LIRFWLCNRRRPHARDTPRQLLSGTKEMNREMHRSHSQLAGDIFAGHFVHEAHANDRLLHLIQRDHAAQSQGMLLGGGDDVVCGFSPDTKLSMIASSAVWGRA